MFLCNFDLYVRIEDLQEYADQLLSRTNERERTDCSLPQSPISSVSDEPVNPIIRPFNTAPTAAVVPETFMSPRQSPQQKHNNVMAAAATSQSTALMTPPPQTKQVLVVEPTSTLPRKRRRSMSSSSSWANPVPSSRHTPSSWMSDTMRAGY